MPHIENRKNLFQKATLDDGIKINKKSFVHSSNDSEIFES